MVRCSTRRMTAWRKSAFDLDFLDLDATLPGSSCCDAVTKVL
jgi:hypothetical protein